MSKCVRLRRGGRDLKKADRERQLMARRPLTPHNRDSTCAARTDTGRHQRPEVPSARSAAVRPQYHDHAEGECGRGARVPVREYTEWSFEPPCDRGVRDPGSKRRKGAKSDLGDLMGQELHDQLLGQLAKPRFEMAEPVEDRVRSTQ